MLAAAILCWLSTWLLLAGTPGSRIGTAMSYAPESYPSIGHPGTPMTVTPIEAPDPQPSSMLHIGAPCACQHLAMNTHHHTPPSMPMTLTSSKAPDTQPSGMLHIGVPVTLDRMCLRPLPQ